MPQYERRNRFILGLLAVGFLAWATMVASPVQAASGPGPFYAEPAWDQKLGCPTIADCPRFLVLTNWNNEAVLDKETGLVWERLPATTLHTWSDARLRCTLRTTGNRKGWRLPSVHELASLAHPSVNDPGPTLQPGHPFNILAQPRDYWSATTDADVSANAWFVDFANAGFTSRASKASSILVWCVRGGQSHGDAY